MKRREADGATIPAWSIAATKAAELPSMMGTSGPSTSIVALSTPIPRSAARTCSAVETSGPLRSPRTVANSVAITDSATACTSRSAPSSPVRTKIKPASIDAGPMVRLTGNPECTPTPVTVACERSVVSRLNFIIDPPTTDQPENVPAMFPQADSLPVSPSHGQTIDIARKSANSRFFTDCYPTYAAFETKVDPIRTRSGPPQVRPLQPELNN